MHATTHRLHRVLVNLRVSSETLSDGQLLARFVAERDEAAFASLLHRHGPMVLAVCRRVLRHAQDAEDAFQATFLILARKAPSVLNRDAVGSWLYRVAQRAAQEARAMRARRQAREKHMNSAVAPGAAAAEPDDWRPLLDRELGRLPAKYQAAIVLCDLEATSRKDAARQLGIPEGTLSSRLANGRKLLAARLARRGFTLGVGALAALVSEGALTANVPATLACGTAKVAVLDSVGQLAAVSPAVAVLMKGVLKTMFMTKLKSAAGVVALAVLALGFGGAMYQTVGAQNGPATGQHAGRPLNELEALRRENELLKLNLQVVLEKVRAQEMELRTFRDKMAAIGNRNVNRPFIADVDGDGFPDVIIANKRASALAWINERNLNVTPPVSIDDALKRLREAKSEDERRQAIDAVEQATQRLRQELGQKKGH